MLGRWKARRRWAMSRKVLKMRRSECSQEERARVRVVGILPEVPSRNWMPLVAYLMDRPGVPDDSTVGTRLDITEINFDDAAALAAEDIAADTDPAGLTVIPDDMLSALIGSSVTGD